MASSRGKKSPSYEGMSVAQVKKIQLLIGRGLKPVMNNYPESLIKELLRGETVVQGIRTLLDDAAAKSGVIMREVEVDYGLRPIDALVATNRVLDPVDPQLLTIERREGKAVKKLVFFKNPSNESPRTYEQLVEIFIRRGLDFADTYAVMAHNRLEPAFASTRPHETFWRPSGHDIVCMSFSQSQIGNSEPLAGLRRFRFGSENWYRETWYVGTPKSQRETTAAAAARK